MSFDHQKIERKWQRYWEKEGFYRAEDFGRKEKQYILIEFPYPSGERLHVGHGRSYCCFDAVARLKRMQGANVLFPIGWDAFGLPAENYAIKTGVHPAQTTKENIRSAKEQARSWGLSFDWSREITTTDPRYYRWTQWIFLQLFKKGLAYKKEIPVNWCPKDKINLANEEVIQGACERCGTPVERRMQSQWLLKITEYADRLLEDLDRVDYRRDIRDQQINWIGRSEGARIKFEIKSPKFKVSDIEVFTTRADTLFGATFLAISPELVRQWIDRGWKAPAKARSYVQKALNQPDRERQKEKTGVPAGITALHPLTGEEIPVWVSSYVLAEYGTGAVMGVPAHDQRDLEFAKKFDLPVKVVIEPVTGAKQENEEFRRSIVAIVKDPSTGKFLSINWGKELGGNLFIGGGISGAEDAASCAKREIEEETGYKNVKYVSSTETIHHHYRAHSKGVNRVIDATGLLFELVDKKQKDTRYEEDEKGKFTVEWLTAEEAERKVQDPLHALVFKLLVKEEVYEGDGIAVNSAEFDGLESREATEKITRRLAKEGRGEKAVDYKLRDWVFSRQHYWGEPIPIIICEEHGFVPVPEKDLPVELPHVERYQPTDTGESPLAGVKEWVEVPCPICNKQARRETDTMPNWAGSSWYFLRYTDPENDRRFADRKKLDYWMPVDWYNGGMEHTTLHLLYSRFWYKVMADLKLVPGTEPYAKRTSHGVVLGPDGQKMSKSRGNVINPDEVVKEFGADAFRLYEAFIGPFEQTIPWDPRGVVGVRRFLDRVWKTHQEVASQEAGESRGDLKRALHRLIKKVEEDTLALKFNTAVSVMMEFVNQLSDSEFRLTVGDWKTFLRVLAPYAPHLSEELYQSLGGPDKKSVHLVAWPKFDPGLIEEETVTVVVQVDGRLRGKFEAPRGSSEEEVTGKARKLEGVKPHLHGRKVAKTVFVPDNLVNFVTA